ncbi:hypothetical protein DERP_002417 [Dermatophagoides pteronyssinus]|uniref:KASH domain-containing protein n=1 Tax=Dermatophagoides pteronyssinus TaxID=6956 RepID=A0ABQ8JHP1_DERPT|nr:hypothetical protein DERP_002417 [Dermatophagoides pteronyssinus]
MIQKLSNELKKCSLEIDRYQTLSTFKDLIDDFYLNINNHFDSLKCIKVIDLNELNNEQYLRNDLRTIESIECSYGYYKDLFNEFQQLNNDSDEQWQKYIVDLTLIFEKFDNTIQLTKEFLNKHWKCLQEKKKKIRLESFMKRLYRIENKQPNPRIDNDEMVKVENSSTAIDECPIQNDLKDRKDSPVDTSLEDLIREIEIILFDVNCGINMHRYKSEQIDTLLMEAQRLTDDEKILNKLQSYKKQMNIIIRKQMDCLELENFQSTSEYFQTCLKQDLQIMNELIENLIQKPINNEQRNLIETKIINLKFNYRHYTGIIEMIQQNFLDSKQPEICSKKILLNDLFQKFQQNINHLMDLLIINNDYNKIYTNIEYITIIIEEYNDIDLETLKELQMKTNECIEQMKLFKNEKFIKMENSMKNEAGKLDLSINRLQIIIRYKILKYELAKKLKKFENRFIDEENDEFRAFIDEILEQQKILDQMLLKDFNENQIEMFQQILINFEILMKKLDSFGYLIEIDLNRKSLESTDLIIEPIRPSSSSKIIKRIINKKPKKIAEIKKTTFTNQLKSETSSISSEDIINNNYCKDFDDITEQIIKSTTILHENEDDDEDNITKIYEVCIELVKPDEDDEKQDDRIVVVEEESHDDKNLNNELIKNDDDDEISTENPAATRQAKMVENEIPKQINVEMDMIIDDSKEMIPKIDSCIGDNSVIHPSTVDVNEDDDENLNPNEKESILEKNLTFQMKIPSVAECCCCSESEEVAEEFKLNVGDDDDDWLDYLTPKIKTSTFNNDDDDEISMNQKNMDEKLKNHSVQQHEQKPDQNDDENRMTKIDFLQTKYQNPCLTSPTPSLSFDSIDKNDDDHKVLEAKNEPVIDDFPIFKSPEISDVWLDYLSNNDDKVSDKQEDLPAKNTVQAEIVIDQDGKKFDNIDTSKSKILKKSRKNKKQKLNENQKIADDDNQSESKKYDNQSMNDEKDSILKQGHLASSKQQQANENFIDLESNKPDRKYMIEKFNELFPLLSNHSLSIKNRLISDQCQQQYEDLNDDNDDRKIKESCDENGPTFNHQIESIPALIYSHENPLAVALVPNDYSNDKEKTNEIILTTLNDNNDNDIGDYSPSLLSSDSNENINENNDDDDENNYAILNDLESRIDTINDQIQSIIIQIAILFRIESPDSNKENVETNNNNDPNVVDPNNDKQSKVVIKNPGQQPSLSTDVWLDYLSPVSSTSSSSSVSTNKFCELINWNEIENNVHCDLEIRNSTSITKFDHISDKHDNKTTISNNINPAKVETKSNEWMDYLSPQQSKRSSKLEFKSSIIILQPVVNETSAVYRPTDKSQNVKKPDPKFWKITNQNLILIDPSESIEFESKKVKVSDDWQDYLSPPKSNVNKSEFRTSIIDNRLKVNRKNELDLLDQQEESKKENQIVTQEKDIDPKSILIENGAQQQQTIDTIVQNNTDKNQLSLIRVDDKKISINHLEPESIDSGNHPKSINKFHFNISDDWLDYLSFEKTNKPKFDQQTSIIDLQPFKKIDSEKFSNDENVDEHENIKLNQVEKLQSKITIQHNGDSLPNGQQQSTTFDSNTNLIEKYTNENDEKYLINQLGPMIINENDKFENSRKELIQKPLDPMTTNKQIIEPRMKNKTKTKRINIDENKQPVLSTNDDDDNNGKLIDKNFVQKPKSNIVTNSIESTSSLAVNNSDNIDSYTNDIGNLLSSDIGKQPFSKKKQQMKIQRKRIPLNQRFDQAKNDHHSQSNHGLSSTNHSSTTQSSSTTTTTKFKRILQYSLPFYILLLFSLLLLLILPKNEIEFDCLRRQNYDYQITLKKMYLHGSPPI